MHYNVQNRSGRATAPSCTDKTITFPYNQSTNKFKSDHYNSTMTNGNVSTEAIQRFLGDIEFHIKTYYAFGGFRLKKILTYLGFALFILYIISIYASLLLPIFMEVPSFLPYAWPVLTVVMIAYAIPACIICSICTSLGERKLEETNKKVQFYINERAMDFKLRGLSWILPSYFPQWIELWKDDPNANIQHYMQPVHMYNPNHIHYSRPGETAEMMQMHSTQQLPQFEIPIHPPIQSQQPKKRGYYELNEEEP